MSIAASSEVAPFLAWLKSRFTRAFVDIAILSSLFQASR